MSGKVERFGLASESVFAGEYCVGTVSIAEQEDGEYVRHSDYAALEARCRELELCLEDAGTLLKKAPKCTMDMYKGRDRVSFGQQAKNMVRRIDAAIAKEREGK